MLVVLQQYAILYFRSKEINNIYILLLILALAYYLSEIKLYKTKVNDFRYRARLSSEILAKIHEKTNLLGLLTKTQSTTTVH